MEPADAIGLTASVVSVILALVAIVVTIVLYRKSSALDKSTNGLLEQVGGVVNRIYSASLPEIASGLKEMQSQVWPGLGAKTRQSEMTASSEGSSARTLERKILSILTSSPHRARMAIEIVDRLPNFSAEGIVAALLRMVREGTVETREPIGPGSIVSLAAQSR